MDSIISSLQSIPKPSFLQQSDNNNNKASNNPQSSRSSQQNQHNRSHGHGQGHGHRQRENENVPPSRQQSQQASNLRIPKNPFQNLSDITLKAHAQNKNEKDDDKENGNLNQIDLPALSFTDFSIWDLQPYNHLFIRERLRFRIESNAKEYAKHDERV